MSAQGDPAAALGALRCHAAMSDFSKEQLSARGRVAIDPNTRIGTQPLFGKLDAEPTSDPAQLVGLEHWPEGIRYVL